MQPLPDFIVQGAQALLLSFGSTPDRTMLALNRATQQQLQDKADGWLLETVPSYCSLLLVFDLTITDHGRVTALVQQLWPQICRQAADMAAVQGKVVELPCYYSTQTGPDLAEVARLHQISQSELITLHSRQTYQVYAIGFAPGFAYLGFIVPELATPRLATPRPQVPAGSVAIADRQTAVYPAASPGGWRLLGNCPVPLFTPEQSPPMPFAVGDEVRFVPVERSEFLRLGGELPESSGSGGSA